MERETPAGSGNKLKKKKKLRETDVPGAPKNKI